MNLLLFTSVWSSSGYLRLVHFVSMYMFLVMFNSDFCFFLLILFLYSLVLYGLAQFCNLTFFLFDWSGSHFPENGPCMFNFIIKCSCCKCTCHWQNFFLMSKLYIYTLNLWVKKIFVLSFVFWQSLFMIGFLTSILCCTSSSILQI